MQSFKFYQSKIHRYLLYLWCKCFQIVKLFSLKFHVFLVRKYHFLQKRIFLKNFPKLIFDVETSKVLENLFKTLIYLCVCNGKVCTSKNGGFKKIFFIFLDVLYFLTVLQYIYRDFNQHFVLILKIFSSTPVFSIQCKPLNAHRVYQYFNFGMVVLCTLGDFFLMIDVSIRSFNAFRAWYGTLEKS